MIDYESIGVRVQYYRKSINMTQEELAEQTKTSRVHISNIERGEGSPSIEVLIDIANALYVSADDLLAGNLFSSNPSRSEEEMDILHDCTKEEKLIMLEGMRTIKHLIRKYKITK